MGTNFAVINVLNRDTMKKHTRYLVESNDEYFVTILDGKVTLFTHGNYICLTSPVILDNGTVVGTDGNVHLPDGSTRMLREGEHI